MKKLLVVDNRDSFVYNLVQWLRETEQAPAFVVRDRDEICWAEADACDAVLLSPGPGIPAEAGRMPELIARCALQKPILGVCLGHQALGEYFGAKLHRLSRPLHGHLSELVRVAPDPLLDTLEEPVRVCRYHSWALDRKGFPDELCITSLSEDGEIMSFRHRELPLHGLQFHPESFVTDQGRRMLDAWLRLC